jgi:type IV pilus modification protein PilV
MRAVQRGFTIIESMIALGIILVGILAITQLQTTQVSAGTASRQRIEAGFYAQQVIENFRAYSALATASGVTAYADIADGSDTVKTAKASYARAWTVEAKTAPDHKRVTVTVTWTATGRTESVTLVTNITPLEPALSGKLITGL